MWKDRIKIGSFVKIFDMDMEEENTYHIISGTKENENDLSFDSPLGKALLDNELGAIITVKAEEEYKVKIISVDNSKVKSVVETFNSINNNSKPKANTLIRNLNKGYGTRAQDIYDDCCKKFGWDYSKRSLFAPQKPLYAAGATPEGYSPLFLAHSNWTESKGSNWTNTITANMSCFTKNMAIVYTKNNISLITFFIVYYLYYLFYHTIYSHSFCIYIYIVCS